MALSASVIRLQRMLVYATGEWRALLAILSLTFISAAVAALQPWPLKILIDYGLGGAPLPQWAHAALTGIGLSASAFMLIALAAIAGMLVLLFDAMLDARITLVWSRAGQRMIYRVATAVFFQLQRLSLLFHARCNTGDAL